MADMLRKLPSVSDVLESPPLKSILATANRNAVVGSVRQFLDDMRLRAQSAAASMQVPSPAELAQRVADWIATGELASPRPVINATGDILASHLGRAPLAEEALIAAQAVGASYANIDCDLKTGTRRERSRAVEGLLAELTGAEATAVVNNNAAATILTLAALASGRQVLVSRGQLVEFAGGGRLPDVIGASGAKLCEVGSANRTRAADFAAAASPSAAAILRVHTAELAAAMSQEPDLQELAALGKRQNLAVIDLLGAAALIDLGPLGLPGVPVVHERLRAGVDVALFSGDQLVGGPQCGLIVGRRPIVQQIAQHPLARAMRVNKLTLAALAATLRLYRDPDRAARQIPVLSLLSTPVANLLNRAERLRPQLAASSVASVEIATGQVPVTSGPLAGALLPTVMLRLRPMQGTAEGLAAALRMGEPAVVSRVEDSSVVLDLRSVPPRDDIGLVAALDAFRRTGTSNQQPPVCPVPPPAATEELAGPS